MPRTFQHELNSTSHHIHKVHNRQIFAPPSSSLELFDVQTHLQQQDP